MDPKFRQTPSNPRTLNDLYPPNATVEFSPCCVLPIHLLVDLPINDGFRSLSPSFSGIENGLGGALTFPEGELEIQ